MTKVKNQTKNSSKSNILNYEILKYSSGKRDTTLVAAELGISPSNLFKSIIVKINNSYFKLLMIPSDNILDMHHLKRIFGGDKVEIAMREEAESITDLKVGGISVLGILDDKIDFYIDNSALQFQSIVISAGKRGFAAKVNVQNLINLYNIKVVDLLAKSQLIKNKKENVENI